MTDRLVVKLELPLTMVGRSEYFDLSEDGGAYLGQVQHDLLVHLLTIYLRRNNIDLNPIVNNMNRL